MSVIRTEDNLEYSFFPLEKFEITVGVKAGHDAHIALAPGATADLDVVEIFLGGWEGAKSAIRLNREKPDLAQVESPGIVSEDEEKIFVIRGDAGGNIEVSLQDAPEPFLAATVEESRRFNVTHFGLRTSWGASGSWRINGVKEVQTSDSTEYTFFPLVGGRLTFDVRASSNAHVALTAGPSDELPIIEIFLGGWDNTKSAIRLNKEKPDKAEAASEGIVNGDEFRRFILTWNYAGVEVRRDGEDEPFLAWANPEPTSITHFGVRTGHGSDGHWNLSQGTAGLAAPPEVEDRPKRDAEPEAEPAAEPEPVESVAISIDGVSWVAASGGNVPEGSLIGGDDNGEPIVVARANFEGAVLPGKLIAAHGVIYIPWGGEEHSLEEYETLVVAPDAVSWVASTGGEVLPNAIPAGTSQDGETLYVGRTQHEGTVTVGKLHPSHETLYISYGGAEIGFPEYEVLVLN